MAFHGMRGGLEDYAEELKKRGVEFRVPPRSLTGGPASPAARCCSLWCCGS